jgi:hypothetical protein
MVKWDAENQTSAQYSVAPETHLGFPWTATGSVSSQSLGGV